MHPRPLGTTDLNVTPICVGTSALGGFAELFGYDVDTKTAVDTITRVFEGPITFIDTSNEYGHGGDSERRIGEAIAAAGGVPPGVVIATKVDPAPGSDDFSGDRVLASVEESMLRLGLDHLPLVYLHDPERMSLEAGTASGGALEALVQLKDAGTIGYIGVAGGSIELELQYLDTGAIDVVLSHNRFTLVDQTAEPVMDAAAERGAGFVNAAPFGGGMLVKGPDAVSTYAYSPASERLIDRVRDMQRACAVYEVPLAAAALQFSMRDARVASTVVGMSRPERVEQTLELAQHPIPDALWEELLPLATVGRYGAE